MSIKSQAKNKSRHIIEELEDEFHSLQGKIGKTRDSYVAGAQKELKAAKKQFKAVQKQLAKTKSGVAKAAAKAKKSSSKSASDQLKKARAASLLLGKSLGEAKEIMVTAKEKLNAAKPFDRKLAARIKVLAQFEKDWDKKMKAEAAARAKKAAARKKKLKGSK
jgi:hypothetical protein